MSYSQRLLEKGNSFTRLAHRSRFNTVLDSVGNTQYQRAIDYGCGDGWLLKTAVERNLIQSGVGIDIAENFLKNCRELFLETPGFEFYNPPEASQKVTPHSYDLAFCTETLEHVAHPEEILDKILFYCQPNAKIVISVPIEIGPSLMFKQVGRYLANLKGDYGYETYKPQELFKAAILWDVNSFPSSHAQAEPYRAHKGFDYRNLEQIVKQKFLIEQQIYSPFPWFGSFLNSTIIWICRPLKT